MAALSNGPAGEPQHAPAQAASAHADNEANAAGEWRRLHWATPILRGGIVLIALIAYVISNGVNGFIQTIQNDRLSEIESSHTPTPTPSPTATPSPSDNGFWDSIPWDQLYGIISTAVWILVIIGAVVLGWAQWRSHRFRIGEDAIEVRKGIISRSERQIRFDRIQGINISKTVLGAIFGLAKLEFDAAGEDANIELAFLKVKDAEALRTEVLTRASGAKQAKAAERATTGVRSADEPLVADEAHAHMASDAAAPGVIPTPAAQSNLERFLRERIGEIAGGEASHEDPATRSVVEVSLARIILSRLMNFAVGLVATLIAIGIITAGVVVTVVATGEDLHNVLLEVSIAIGFSSLRAPAVVRYGLRADPAARTLHDRWYARRPPDRSRPVRNDERHTAARSHPRDPRPPAGPVAAVWLVADEHHPCESNELGRLRALEQRTHEQRHPSRRHA